VLWALACRRSAPEERVGRHDRLIGANAPDRATLGRDECGGSDAEVLAQALEPPKKNRRFLHPTAGARANDRLNGGGSLPRSKNCGRHRAVPGERNRPWNALVLPRHGLMTPPIARP
jgi:hypothetical protein